MLQSGEVERERDQHGRDREDSHEQPLSAAVLLGDDLPGWIHQLPENSRTQQRIHQHRPALVNLKQVLTVDVVEGERDRRQLRGHYAYRIEANPGDREPGKSTLRRQFSDRQSATQHSQDHAAYASHRWALKPARQHVQQHPHRRHILQDDCRRNARLLDGEIIEVVGGRKSENPQQKELDQMAAAQAQRRPPLQQQNWQEYQQGNCGSALGQDERVNRAQGLPADKEPAGKDRPAQGGRKPPEKRGRGDEEIAAHEMSLVWRAVQRGHGSNPIRARLKGPTWSAVARRRLEPAQRSYSSSKNSSTVMPDARIGARSVPTDSSLC